MNSYGSITPGGLAAFKAEKVRLLDKRISAVANLRTAREMGDLSENAAYHVAKRELSSIDSRLRYLEKIIRTSTVVEQVSGDRVGIGSKVSLESGSGEMAITLVGGYESDPSKGKISNYSPLGRAISGKKKGDKVAVVTPNGTVTYFIKEISA